MIAMDINKLNRFPAFGIHLGLSFVIFVVLAYLVIFVWYPSFFFDTDGGWYASELATATQRLLLWFSVYRKRMQCSRQTHRVSPAPRLD